MEALVSGHPRDVAANENRSCMQPLDVKGFEDLLWGLTQQQINTGMQFRILVGYLQLPPWVYELKMSLLQLECGVFQQKEHLLHLPQRSWFSQSFPSNWKSEMKAHLLNDMILNFPLVFSSLAKKVRYLIGICVVYNKT